MMIILSAAYACTSGFPAAAASQTDDAGVIDIGKERQKKIAELEAKLKLDPDKAAKDQAVLLQWLIELYSAAGRYQDVTMSYDKILSFYPYDVRIINRYAEFVLEKLHNAEMAESLLNDAVAYAKIYNVSTRFLGDSYFLLGKLCFMRENHPAAVEHLERARFLFGEETPEPAIRLLAMSYHAAGRHDEALDVLLELIGKARGTNQNDIELLRRIIPLTNRMQGKEITEIVADAVQTEIQRQRALHEAFGAEMISIPVGDTVALEGSLYRGEAKGAVLFIPEIGSTRSAWGVFAQMVSVNGITALSIDLRGHGGSRTESVLFPKVPTEPDIQPLANDIAFVLQYMKTNLGKEEDEIVVVSEGRICSAIEVAFHRCNLTPAAVYLSPFFDPENRELYNAIAFRKDRPLLIMYSQEDVLASRSVRHFMSIKSLSNLSTLQLKDAGHGRDALRMESNALAEFDQWIRGLLQSP